MAGLAMKLTFARIFFIPLFVLFYYWHPVAWGQWGALSVYTLACLTDYLDGYCARKSGETSAFGAFLDPVADKLMVCAVLLVLLQSHPDIWLVLVAMILIGREIWISALREWMASMGMREAVAVSRAGKWKTAAQMIALGFLIFRAPILGLPLWRMGQTLLLIAALLSLYSMTVYNRAAWLLLARDDHGKGGNDGAQSRGFFDE